MNYIYKVKHENENSNVREYVCSSIEKAQAYKMEQIVIHTRRMIRLSSQVEGGKIRYSSRGYRRVSNMQEETEAFINGFIIEKVWVA